LLLDKGGVGLKAFVPQLQTTFVKALNDPSKVARGRASKGLGRLMPLTSRVDSLLNELCNASANAESPAIKSSILDGLSEVLLKGGDKATPPSIEKATYASFQGLLEEDENVRTAASRCTLGLGAFMDATKVFQSLADLLEPPVSGEPWTSTTGRLIGLGGILATSGQKNAEKRSQVFSFIAGHLNDERVAVKVAACSAIARILSTNLFPGYDDKKSEIRACGQGAIHAFAKILTTAASDSSAEVRRAAISAIKEGAKHYPGASGQHLQSFMPPLVSALHEVNLSVKYAAERAMKYLLDGGNNPAIMTTYAAGADSGTVTFVKDYAKRVLSKLTADSEDEAGKW